MKRTVVYTDKVPPARVPLSQAIKIGDWVFASGQLGMDPKTGRLIEGGIKAETRQVCENLSRAGSGRLLAARVAKVTIYLADLAELMAMNEVFREYFPNAPPARTTVQAAGLVAGARVNAPNMAFFDCGGVRLYLACGEGADHQGASSYLYFRTTDLPALREALHGKGVTIHQEPQMLARMPDHDLWLMWIRDSETNLLGLMEERKR